MSARELRFLIEDQIIEVMYRRPQGTPWTMNEINQLIAYPTKPDSEQEDVEWTRATKAAMRALRRRRLVVLHQNERMYTIRET
jgi:hypothetical protein